MKKMKPLLLFLLLQGSILNFAYSQKSEFTLIELLAIKGAKPKSISDMLKRQGWEFIEKTSDNGEIGEHWYFANNNSIPFKKANIFFDFYYSTDIKIEHLMYGCRSKSYFDTISHELHRRNFVLDKIEKPEKLTKVYEYISNQWFINLFVSEGHYYVDVRNPKIIK